MAVENIKILSSKKNHAGVSATVELTVVSKEGRYFDTYVCSRVSPMTSLWLLTHLGRHEAYAVTCNETGPHVCTCPDHRYTPDRDPKGCKHRQLVAYLLQKEQEGSIWA